MDNWSEGQKLDYEPGKWVLGHLVDSMTEYGGNES